MRLLKGARRTGKTFFGGKLYHKSEGFIQAQQDFRSVKPRDVEQIVRIILIIITTTIIIMLFIYDV